MNSRSGNVIIRVEDLSFTYQGMNKPAIENVSMEIMEGQCVLLCGKSGCGKTTMTRVLNGLVPEFFKGELSGSCFVDGLKCGNAAVEDFVPVVGSVFQNPKTQYFNTDTTAELAFPCENAGLPPEEISARIQERADRYGLSKLLDRSIFRLSGGEKQKIAFGAATMLSPKLLVLDEPTSNLDAAAIAALHDMLEDMKKSGMTIVLAEHRLAWVADLVDRYYFFEDGRLCESYSLKEFLQLSDDELEQRGLRSVQLEPYKEKIEVKCNKSIDNTSANELSVKNVVIGYNKKKPVYTVKDLKLKSGEIVGIMGHNGIGKSTLIKTITGLIKPLSGCILWNGEKQNTRSMKKRSFLVMQDVNYQLFSDSVHNEVMLDTEDEDRCDEVLERLGLTPYAQMHPMSLSGGQKQRTAIASAMVSSKELIVMDEPTSGLDRYHMQQVGGLIQELKNQGKMVVVITHDEELAAGWCDRIYRMED